MLTIPNVATQDGFTERCTLGPVPSSEGVTFVVANAAALCQVAATDAAGVVQGWGPELLITPQSNTVQRCQGIRFRSAVPGVPAAIVATLFEPRDPILGGGTAFDSILSPSGGITPPGGVTELAYNEFVAPVAIGAVTEGTANLVIAAASVNFDGTPVLIDFFAPRVLTPTSADCVIDFVLRDDTAGVSLGLLGRVRSSVSAGLVVNEIAARLARRLTPVSGARIYSVRAFVNGGGGSVGAGPGAAGQIVPGYIRITTAS